VDSIGLQSEAPLHKRCCLLGEGVLQTIHIRAFGREGPATKEDGAVSLRPPVWAGRVTAATITSAQQVARRIVPQPLDHLLGVRALSRRPGSTAGKRRGHISPVVVLGHLGRVNLKFLVHGLVLSVFLLCSYIGTAAGARRSPRGGIQSVGGSRTS